ncbi:hypothetical protein CRE_02511 [Caenorhabditis remanei]|uniref:Uncharacterized protein n=1 Tax=Caenorhabditis remanei TaxID=31234 RepID=E3MWN3_CAERE|nr:hypothetical protein CRE_02511 [Caenorhabditis remanei]
MCLLCPFDFRNFPRNQVNVSEFYHRSWKFIVYRHAACGHFWIQKDYSMRMHIPCPRCYQTSTEPLAAFISLQEAQEYNVFVICHQQHEMIQLKVAQNMNEKIKFIEMTKPKDEVYYMGTKVTRPIMDGSFYEKWVNLSAKDLYLCIYFSSTGKESTGQFLNQAALING